MHIFLVSYILHGMIFTLFGLQQRENACIAFIDRFIHNSNNLTICYLIAIIHSGARKFEHHNHHSCLGFVNYVQLNVMIGCKIFSVLHHNLFFGEVEKMLQAEEHQRLTSSFTCMY